MDNRCDWGNPKQLKRAGCKKSAYLQYLGLELCHDHWEMLCKWQEEGREDAAYKKIGLPPRERNQQEVEIEPVKPVGEELQVEETPIEELPAEETPTAPPPQQPFRKRRR